jgi:hypothetical protein
MGEACSSKGRGEVHINSCTKTELRENLEELEADGRIIYAKIYIEEKG